jgi:7,8-dihydroneopterin aldolase/epimerase/oxygenase
LALDRPFRYACSQMIGTAGVKGLRIDAVVGILPHEREAPQPLSVDVEVDYDFAPAAASEGIADAVDYAKLASELSALIQARKFLLIETLAEEAARWVLEQHPSVRAVRLEVRKPEAVPAADCAFTRVARQRS